uniref:type-1 angiotensin II receptor-associated protein-like n=1 Tax=Ciona intestinalis TaxID=7719 RepID=UPI0000522A2D|nr:type-1 angiotensin II receptor-associated protein-like [Ciona intestinalis]|eukprot:XP_002131411.1 type-1 angiotensin II receptor-associated protein-like [Ciona intestinalis]
MPSISIKAIVLVHWILVMWTTLGWAPSSFLYPNLSVLIVGFWAVADKQSVDAVFMFIVMQIGSVIVDIVNLSLYFPPYNAVGQAKFSAGMAILNLILKPFSTILLYQMYSDRGGQYNINFGPNTPSYDQIDGNPNDSSTKQGSTAYFPPPPTAEQGS